MAKLIRFNRKTFSKHVRAKADFEIDDDKHEAEISKGDEFYTRKTGKKGQENYYIVVIFEGNALYEFEVTKSEYYYILQYAHLIEDFVVYRTGVTNYAGGRSKNYRNRSLSKGTGMLKRNISLS